MNWVAAMSTGFGLGLAYFAGLWLSVRRLRLASAGRFALERAARIGIAGIMFYALLKTGGITALIAALAGWMAARWYFVREIGSATDGQ